MTVEEGCRRRGATGAPTDRCCPLTLPPGALDAAPLAPPLSDGSRFEVLVEDVEDTSSDESPPVPEWSTVRRRGRRSDYELAQDFWTEIGFPTLASRFSEKLSSPSSGTCTNISSGCCFGGDLPALSSGQAADGATTVTGAPRAGCHRHQPGSSPT
jgi:hypothetical protein